MTIFNDELKPKTAELIWRDNAKRKLKHALQLISGNHSRMTPKTQSWRVQAEAYECILAVYSDLLDLTQ